MADCNDLRIQHAAAQAERDERAQEEISDRGDPDELLKDQQHVNPQIVATAQAKLSADRVRLRQLDDQLASLMSALVENHCFAMQPAEILQIQFANPGGVKNV